MDVTTVDAAAKNVKKEDLQKTADFEPDFESEFKKFDSYLRDGIELKKKEKNGENVVTPQFNKVRYRFLQLLN
ncbi:hypothetical protein [Virgibacillus proomii]|uniref:hypothetical protein n=1 Tax=Virgibacillus proomii TaxID=84407 RepID=UPI001C1106A3|nr:hypothetical protein [Virgibacillus proomii]MBU5266890.1 hypothetical protein [Virgibacillus proomii]